MKSPLLNQLISEFSRLPGIGPKSATRLAFHMLSVPKNEAHRLGEVLKDALEGIGHCKECFQFTEDEVCEICLDTRRNRSQICVVERASDLLGLERSGGYNGLYHVLGGHLSPLDGIGPEDLHFNELLERLDKHPVEEIILALGGSAEADATALYLERTLKGRSVTLTRLARGIPVGADLEYLDERTLFNAMESRTKF